MVTAGFGILGWGAGTAVAGWILVVEAVAAAIIDTAAIGLRFVMVLGSEDTGGKGGPSVAGAGGFGLFAAGVL